MQIVQKLLGQDSKATRY